MDTLWIVLGTVAVSIVTAVYAHLVKPVDFGDLLQLLAALLPMS